jgi:signal transduction histidine kinase
MLLKERAGPLSDPQRRLLEEAEKSCGRLSALVAEMSDLSQLEGGGAAIKRSRVDLAAIVRDTIGALPRADADVTIEVTSLGALPVDADSSRLTSALSALLSGLRREVVTADRLSVQCGAADVEGRRAARVTIGTPDQIPQLEAADVRSLSPFDEWRGGCGLSLAIARRIITAHGGRVLSPAGEAKCAAVVLLPAAAD